MHTYMCVYVCIMYIGHGLKQSHMYANIDASPRLRQSGILETSECESVISLHDYIYIQQYHLMQNLK